MSDIHGGSNHDHSSDREDGDELGPLKSLDTDEASIDGKRLYIQSSEPTSPETDDVWVDIS